MGAGASGGRTLERLAAEAEAGGGAERVAAPRSVGNGIGIALLGAYLAVLVGRAEVDAVKSARNAGAIDLATVALLAKQAGMARIQRTGRRGLALDAAGDREQRRLAKVEGQLRPLSARGFRTRIEAVGGGRCRLVDRREQTARDDRVDRQRRRIILGDCR